MSGEKKSGQFITLEGIEGAGKNSHIEAMRAHLEARGFTVRVTREPGGAPVSESVRRLLLDPGNLGMDADTELLLVFAARAEHLAKVIRPSLEAGEWVLCDRFTDATYAYQGGGRGIETSRIAALEDWVQGKLRPDLVILLDIDPELGLARAASRSDKDRFEQEEVAFFHRVRKIYLERAAAMPKRYRIIDSSPERDSVRAQILKVLETLK